MPRYRRPHRSQPNPEVETVRTYKRVRVHPRARSPYSPTAQDDEDSPGPTTATSCYDPTRHTHAHTSAKGHSPADGQWWQRWTHPQLWVLRKWARAEPSLEGLVCRPRRGSGENCRLQPAGWMPQAAWEAIPKESTRTTSPHPRTIRMSSNACQKPSRRRGGKRGACGPSPQAQPCAYTPPPQPTSVDAQATAAPATPREPRAPKKMTRLTPRPAAPPPNNEGGYSLGCPRAARRRRPLPAQQPAHPPQRSQRWRTRWPAEPPRRGPSLTTRPRSLPAVGDRYPLPSQPPPPNATPNTAQKPSEPKADEQ